MTNLYKCIGKNGTDYYAIVKNGKKFDLIVVKEDDEGNLELGKRVIGHGTKSSHLAAITSNYAIVYEYPAEVLM